MKLNKGDKARCISITTTGPYITPAANVLYTVTRCNGPHFWTEEFPNQYFNVNEFVKVMLDLPTLLKMKEEITTRLNNEIAIITSKIAYVQETGSLIFDTTEYQVWSVLRELEDKSLSALDRAKKITLIIKG
jgi:hypothetical protein